jgi:hypothetical protein
MKSGPKNMPPPQPHPQSCIMASLASIIFCESSKPRLKNRRRNRFDAGQGGYAVDLRILRTEGADPSMRWLAALRRRYADRRRRG